MPHAWKDRLLPGETLLPGDYLESANGLYRMYFEPAHYLAEYAYTIDTPIPGLTGNYNIRTWLWGRGGETESPAVRLAVPSMGASKLYDAGGNVIWSTGEWGVNENLSNDWLVLQDDGNLVQYQNHGTYAKGNGADVGAGNCLARSYPPETATAIIRVGQVAVDANDGEITNGADRLIGVRDGNRYVGLPSGASVATATTAGQLVVETYTPSFLSLSGPLEDRDDYPSGASSGRGSGDAIAKQVVHHDPDKLYQLVVTPSFGLSLSGPPAPSTPAFLPPEYAFARSRLWAGRGVGRSSR